MRQPFLRTFAVLALALAAACSGNGADPASDPTAAEVPQGGEPTATAEPAGETAAEPAGDEAETLAGLMGWGGENAETDARDQEGRIQEDIRVCMAELGFDYMPAVAPEGTFEVWEEADEEERVRTQGFGITTWFGNEEELAGGAEWVDPNQDKVEAMSQSERQAWNDALYGSEEEHEASQVEHIDEETGETYYVGDRYGLGCSGKAYETAYGGKELEALWEELSPAFEELHQRVQADPRIVDANAEWSTCMAAAGYDGLASRDEMGETAYDDFQQRFDAIVDLEQSDPLAGWSEAEVDAFFEEKTQEEINAVFKQAQQEAEANVDQEALAALQQEEIDMAVADWECGQGLNDLLTEVSEDFEGDFIAENQATLEQIRDAQGG